jgi:hypothetical protein
MQTIKTYRKVGAFYIACEADLSTPILTGPSGPQPNVLPSRTKVVARCGFVT